MNYFSLAVFILATGLTQWHGFHFWTDLTGNNITGALWSVSIEAAALWLWVRGGLMPVAIVASTLLLAGPLIHIVSPALLQAKHNSLAEQQRQINIKLIDEEITIFKNSLATFLTITEGGRKGWYDQINTDKEHLVELHQQRRTLIKNTTAASQTKAYLNATMQAGALFVVWLVSVMAMRNALPVALPTGNYPTSNKEVPQKKEPVTPVKQQTLFAETQTITQQIDAVLTEYLNQQNISAAQWAKDNGLQAKDVTNVRNHDRLLREGTPRASNAKITRIAELLNLSNEGDS